jgi:hypothetical protein
LYHPFVVREYNGKYRELPSYEAALPLLAGKRKRALGNPKALFNFDFTANFAT